MNVGKIALACLLECFVKTVLAYVYQLESQVMKSNNKESSHNLKLRKYIDNLEKREMFDFS